MGLILDSSVLIADERRGAREMLEQFKTEYGEVERSVPVHPINVETARLDGRVEGRPRRNHRLRGSADRRDRFCNSASES